MKDIYLHLTYIKNVVFAYILEAMNIQIQHKQLKLLPIERG